MSFFKKLFAKPEQPRTINSVDDLNVNDIIIFDDSFSLPALIRGKQLQVTSVNSYEYQHNTETEWVLKGDSQQQIFLSVYHDDQSYLKLSIKLADDDVACLFDLDDFADVFEQGDCVIDKRQDNDLSDGWTASQYHRYSFAKVGYFHRKDHRQQALSPYQGNEQGEQFELYQLAGDNDRFGIDIEVWEDGDTDVLLHLYRPLTDIKDMYPGS